jgi:hypothetical protein
MGVKMQAGTTALHENDSAVLAAQHPAGTSTTAQRGEHRTDADPHQDCQQLGVISDSVAQGVGSASGVPCRDSWDERRRTAGGGSVLPIVGGKVVYATSACSHLAPPPLPISPSWSPVRHDSGYAKAGARPGAPARSSLYQHAVACATHHVKNAMAAHTRTWVSGAAALWSLHCECCAI